MGEMPYRHVVRDEPIGPTFPMRKLVAYVLGFACVACGGGATGETASLADSEATDSAPLDDGSAVDGGAEADASPAIDAAPEVEAPSRCTQTAINVTCQKEQSSVVVTSLVSRNVYYQTPLGEPPAKGWPVAILFQGSFFGAAIMWSGDAGLPFGPYWETLTIKTLLDRGYAVLTPEAHGSGSTFWDTNIPPWDVDWKDAPDAAFMEAIFAAIEGGKFGPLDRDSMFAGGISSGGYMTSRMAVSYAGRFKALAIHSGSYAICGGPACVIPDPLPSDHPPTLFLHGQLDPAVPIASMQAYAKRLADEGRETKIVIDPTATHTWIAAAPEAIASWFDAHR
jgi:poly(3-hydroxybutyrate) depolymerase